MRQFSYIALPLVHPRYRTSDTLGVAKERSTAFTRSDLLLSSEEWTSRVVGVISPWVAREIDTIGRGALPQERGHGGGALRRMAWSAEQSLKRELAWASHLNLPGVILPTPPSSRCINYARCVNQVLRQARGLQVWLRVPLCPTRSLGDSDIVDEQYGDLVRRMNNNNKKVQSDTAILAMNGEREGGGTCRIRGRFREAGKDEGAAAADDDDDEEEKHYEYEYEYEYE